MICIYHSRDLDGFASGAIVKLFYPDAKLIGFDYGEKLPMDQIPSGEKIVMIDVSLPMQEMDTLAAHSGWQLTWIDHHISAIKDFEKYTEGKENFCSAILRNGVAACELAWKHFYPTSEMPYAVSLLGKYDTWRNSDPKEWSEEILPFQYGMRLICNSPETFPVDLFDDRDSDVLKIIRNGKTIIEYQNSQNALLCKRAAFECSISGYRAICLNMGGASSQAFLSVYDESKHDVMMPFFFNGREWVFSLYTTKPEVDCSAIAKERGGGGHKGAAGFQASSLESIIHR